MTGKKGDKIHMMKNKTLVIAFTFLTVLIIFANCAYTSSAQEVSDGKFIYTVENGEATLKGCYTQPGKNIVIPESIDGYPVTSLGSKAFYNCKEICTITIPSSIEYIGKDAFYGCTAIEIVNVKSLKAWCEINFEEVESNPLCWGKQATLYLNGLPVPGSLNIPNGTEKISKAAFYNQKHVTEVYLPSSLKEIESSSFGNCTGIKKVNISDLKAYCELDIEDSSASPLQYRAELFLNGEKIAGDLVIPEGTRSVCKLAFYYCSGITSVKIPSSVEKIGENAFSVCTGISAVYIDSLEAFCKCIYESYDSNPIKFSKNLWIGDKQLSGTLAIPSEIERINDNTFYSVYAVDEVILHSEIGYIGMQGFAYTGDKLTSFADSLEVYDSQYSLYASDIYCYRYNQPLREYAEKYERNLHILECPSGRCVYDRKIPDDKYLARPQSCTQNPLYYMSCECGKVGEETFELKVLLAHWPDYEHGYEYSEHGHRLKCRYCDERLDYEDHIFDSACDAICDLCGFEREAGHRFSSEYTYNDYSHFIKCDFCDEYKESPTSHVFENYCDKDCAVCSYVREREHNYSEYWYNDESGHYHKCTRCGTRKDSEEHRFDNPCDADCNVCIYSREASHTYGNEYVYDGDVHFYECAICKDRQGISEHVYVHSCDKKCYYCNYTREALHNSSQHYSYDENGHYFECISCHTVKLDYAEHVYDSSCDEVCNLCSYRRKIEHRYQTVFSLDEDMHWYECAICHTRKSEELHEFENSCDTECDKCSYKREVVHTYGENLLYNGEYHYIQCIFCLKKKDVSPHVYDNACDAECNLCSGTRQTEHSFQEALFKDKDFHYYECSICHTRKDVVAHKSSGAASEDADEICTVCGFVITPKLGHIHRYGEHFIGNETSHWLECACGDRSETGVHVYSSACDEKCNVCDYERIARHDFSEEMRSNDAGHYYECRLCGTRKNEMPHVYDSYCDEICDGCGYTREARHQYGQKWMYNAEYHFRKCEICKEQQDVQSHISSGNATEECAEICTVCSFVINEMLEHVHKYSDTFVYSDDFHWKECSSCHHTSIMEEHRYAEPIVIKQPTLTEFGEKKYVCEECGRNYNERIDKLSLPITSEQTTSVPTTSAPTTSAPTTSVPITSEQTTSVPTTSVPTTSAPTTSAPTTSAPTTSVPTTSAPTTSARSNKSNFGTTEYAIVFGSLILFMALVTLVIVKRKNNSVMFIF